MTNLRNETSFSLFYGLNNRESKEAGFDEILRLIKYDNSVERWTNEYRLLLKVSKSRADKEVKESKSYGISVPVVFNGEGKRAEDIVRTTGYGFVDIDHIEDVMKAKALVIQDPRTVMCYITYSGKGLRIIFRYEREDKATDDISMQLTYPAAFRKANETYARLTGCEYDKQCADITHLCGLSHDPFCYYSEQAKPFIITEDDLINELSRQNEGKAGRKATEYEMGSQTASIEQAAPFVTKILEKNHTRFTKGHHHDYVMHAAFLFNRYGVNLDEVLEYADNHWSEYDARQRESTIRSCYKKSSDFGTYKLPGKKRSKENILATLENIREYLQSHVDLRYNMITDRTEWKNTNQKDWFLYDKRAESSFRCWMSRDLDKRVLHTDVVDVVESDNTPIYNPAKEYLEGLPAWDEKTDYIRQLCNYVHVIPTEADNFEQEKADAYFYNMMTRYLAGTIATWTEDDKVSQAILVLIGEQGIYKTTFFRYLLPPCLRNYMIAKNINTNFSKDDKIAMTSNFLFEFEEVSAMNITIENIVKEIATLTHVKERRPYARYVAHKPRCCMFAGSGNYDQFLTDETGNRRWLVFKVSDIESPYDWDINYDGLYAQLKYMHDHHHRFWFTTTEQEVIEKHNEFFHVRTREEEEITTFLRKPEQGEPYELRSAAELVKQLSVGYKKDLSKRRISLVMGKKKFEKIKKNGNWLYKVKILDRDTVARMRKSPPQEGQIFT